ncbi:MAG: hypothetical protein MHM6MM_000090 [Cercozoa sp. M6MM]
MEAPPVFDEEDASQVRRNVLQQLKQRQVADLEAQVSATSTELDAVFDTAKEARRSLSQSEKARSTRLETRLRRLREDLLRVRDEAAAEQAAEQAADASEQQSSDAEYVPDQEDQRADDDDDVEFELKSDDVDDEFVEENETEIDESEEERYEAHEAEASSDEAGDDVVDLTEERPKKRRRLQSHFEDDTHDDVFEPRRDRALGRMRENAKHFASQLAQMDKDKRARVESRLREDAEFHRWLEKRLPATSQRPRAGPDVFVVDKASQGRGSGSGNIPHHLPWRLRVPRDLWRNLLKHQRQCLQWQFALHRRRCGGILADEMGLGKTVQTVSFLAALRHSGRLARPVLICAPASVLAQWTREFHRWAPEFRVFLSGAPLQNHLKELWSLLDFAAPGRLGELAVFESRFCVPIKRGASKGASRGDVELGLRCAKALKALVAPYLLRRTKHDLRHSFALPKKTEKVLFCRLTAAQRRAYLSVLDTPDVVKVLRTGDTNRGNMLRVLTQLRKVCNHADLRYVTAKTRQEQTTPLPEDFGAVERSGKLQALQVLLHQWLKQADDKVLVFTQTRQMADIVQQLLEAVTGQHTCHLARLDGATPVGTRTKLVARFRNDPSLRVFLMTTRAGGLGLNLTAANRIVIVDPDWNPSTDVQARERAHRIGQQRAVHIYRLVTRGTIEEKIYTRQLYKQFLSDKVMKDPNARRFFRMTSLADLLRLDDQDDDADTQNETLVEGDIEDSDDNNGDDNNGDDNNGDEDNDDSAEKSVMKALLSHGGVSSAFDHSRLASEAAPKLGTSLRVMQQKAQQQADKAVAELRRSGAARRHAAHALLAERVSAASATGQSSGSSVLARLREQRAQVARDTRDRGTSDTRSGSLAHRVLQLLRRSGGSLTSQQIVRRFESSLVADSDKLTLRHILRRVATLRRTRQGEARWVLRSEFAELSSPDLPS